MAEWVYNQLKSLSVYIYIDFERGQKRIYIYVENLAQKRMGYRFFDRKSL